MTRILLWDIGSARRELNEPLGIEMLAGALNTNLFDVDVTMLWGDADPVATLPDPSRFDIIGLSVKLGKLGFLEQTLRMVSTMAPGSVIVLGDVLPTFGYREILARWPEVMCVRGEGETALVELSAAASKGLQRDVSTLAEISNLAYRVNDRIVETDRAQEDLGHVARPRREFLSFLKQRGGIIRIEASRGCAWSNCTFCCIREKYGAPGWRAMPLQYVLSQLIEISHAGGRFPYFTDEDFFGLDYARAAELARNIIRAKRDGDIDPKLDFYLSASVRDIVAQECHEALRLLRRAGLREVFLGIEAGSKDQLKRYGKPATPDLNRHAIRLLRGMGIQLDVGYILFEPEMTFEELRENMSYLEILDLAEHDSRSLKQLRVEALTPMAHRYASEGILTGPLNLDSLCFPVRYSDDRVSWVLETFVAYEQRWLSSAYLLQAFTRGEIQSEAQRMVGKRALGQLRKHDFEALKAIVSCAAGELEIDMMTTVLSAKQRAKESVLAVVSKSLGIENP